jgi:Zn-dependent peptidase ImmA (M78 family)
LKSWIRRRSRRDEAGVESACAALFSECGGPGTLAECIDAVAAARGRRIIVAPSDLADTEIFGIWFELDDRDLILVDRHASPAHRNHIVGHELGHIVLGHGTAPGLAAAAHEVPVRCRRAMDSSLEQDAELFARILQSELLTRQAGGYRRVPSAAARRMAASLNRSRRC